MYKIVYTKKFKQQAKKISPKDLKILKQVLISLSNNQPLEPKYKDHKLKGEYKDFRECHILPDLLLIYRKIDEILVLEAFRLGSHSELF